MTRTCRTNSSRVRLAAALALACATALLAVGPAQAVPPSASGRLLVGFEKGVSKDRQQSIISSLEGRIAHRFGPIRGGRLVLVRARSSKATDVLRKRLLRNPAVAYAEPDFFQFASATTPDDPYYSLDYAVVNSPQGHDIDAPDAWGTRTSCSKVATLDTGVDTDHPDLTANILKTSDKPNNDKDDDHNGYVDDTYGWNVINGKGSGEDDNGHGTHVAGIIGALGNNANGIAGVCWSTKIVPVKFMNSKGKGSTSNAIDGIHYAVHAGVKIINCSFGSSAKSSSLEDAVQYAKSNGVLIVVAAGNDSENIDKSPIYPASYTDGNILTVAASTSSDTLASFSNYGPKGVDVAAPGDSIFSTYLGGGYKTLSGTSMAAPYVSGVAALLRKQESDATYSDLRTAIRQHVDKPPALNGKDVYDGRLNASKALGAIASLVH
ncbi:MAG TPA: S8 family peptidase [Thermoleophilaceae bacterium]